MFDGASAILFGGAKGIGKAVAIEWARRGARVAIADLDLAAAEETAGEIVAMRITGHDGRRAMAQTLDRGAG